jgi:hypothetical protein
MDESVFSREELLKRIEAGWIEHQDFIKALTPQQLTGPRDEEGWNIKDHIVHIAIWEDGIDALLKSRSRAERMGISEALWNTGSINEINEVIQERFQSMPLADALKMGRMAHGRLIMTIRALPHDAILWPYNRFVPDSDKTLPVLAWIIGSTYEHYAMHRPWMETLARQDSV